MATKTRSRATDTSPAATETRSPRFRPAALAFFRALERHNDREWFRSHRAVYEAEVRAPMVTLVERLARDLRRFAPDLIASPNGSIYRPYRDTRFSEDKRPLKTFVSAVFPCRELPKHAGAGLYLEVSARHVLVAGGIYAPQPGDLRRVRSHLAENHRRFEALVRSPRLARAVGGIRGDALKRMPAGFPAGHPAGKYLRLRQYLMGREFPARFATSLRFYSTVVRLFALMAPVVHFLNEPLLAAPAAVDPLAPAGRR